MVRSEKLEILTGSIPDLKSGSNNFLTERRMWDKRISRIFPPIGYEDANSSSVRISLKFSESVKKCSDWRNRRKGKVQGFLGRAPRPYPSLNNFDFPATAGKDAKPSG